VVPLETAPALPVDLNALAALAIEATSAAEPADSASPGDAGASEVKIGSDGKPVTDYTTQIGNGMKERERRLLLLNEAMMKLREAGELEDAARVEERIRALLEMPAPSQAGAKLRTELDQLRAKNDDLTLQLLALQEELKRYRPASSTASNGNSSRNKGVASADR
jgi:hypothetical protein